MHIYKLNRLLAATVITLLALAHALSAEIKFNADNNLIAVKGYDVVAYFTSGEPTQGSDEFEHVWRDVRWQFSSEQNKQMFASDPSRFAPRYGGYCAGGVALGNRAPIDPEAFVIVDGKLYLNFDKPTAEKFAASEDTIAKADENWEKMSAAN